METCVLREYKKEAWRVPGLMSDAPLGACVSSLHLRVCRAQYTFLSALIGTDLIGASQYCCEADKAAVITPILQR